jgi:hypothetical protein
MQEVQYIEINDYGSKFYYKDKAMTILHRLDGPAVEYADGDKWWYVDGKCHRLDGPAVEYSNGDKGWYINGESISEDEFFKRTDWREDQHIVDLRYLSDMLAFDVDTASDRLKTDALKTARLIIETMYDDAMKVKRENGFLG